MRNNYQNDTVPITLSGAQKAKANLEAFQTWSATQTDGDLTQIIRNGQLNRVEVAKAICCGTSALRQNPALKNALADFESTLRERNILPPLTHAAKINSLKPKEYDTSSNQRSRELNRLSAIEKENIELKAQLHELQAKLSRFGELSEVLSEMGMMPR